MNDPLFLLCGLVGAVYVGRLWWTDFQAWRAGRVADHRPLPGATGAPGRAVAIAMAGALLLVALETWGELTLDVAAEQSTITVLFAVYSVLGAAVIEELMFRGFLVIDGRGRALLVAGILAASALFAVLHPFLWQYEDGAFSWRFGAKGWLSTGAVFGMSLWLYACRFAGWNPARSLIPCFAAHATKNLAVVGVKAAQGFLVGLW